MKIKDNLTKPSSFEFKPIKEEFISKQINKLNLKKATGCDGISTKILKLAKTTVIKPITNMINLTIKKSHFPNDAKKAVVAPLHMKNSCLDKENFCPMSILPILSKLYEKALNAKLTEYFNHHFYIFLSAFWAQYGCQSTLLRVIEDWKQALDQNKYVAAILMDLSKAFDCLRHDLLLLKLKTNGLSENALKLMASYLTNRKQCTKLGNFKSNFQSILKGLPQGSILGPVPFNIFINDIFHFNKNCKLYNYADDNTVSRTDTNLKKLIDELVEDSTRLIQWFADNQMKANPGKASGYSCGQAYTQ